MISIIRQPVIKILSLLGVVFNSYAGDSFDAIKNLQQPTANHYAAGQPTAEQLTNLQQAGIKHVINLRPRQEQGKLDESQLLSKTGIHYHHLPITNANDLNHSNVEQLHSLLAKIGKEKVLLHCASSNRVGALMALRANWLQGMDATQALELGKAYGLTTLETAVQAKLQP